MSDTAGQWICLIIILSSQTLLLYCKHKPSKQFLLLNHLIPFIDYLWLRGLSQHVSMPSPSE